ncbi:toll/interleukin-1 receptor domain-containing protein [Flavobacterium sp. LS2R12]|uniref:toll/interleukin-1 receptor domain-containing protein n=1 Tax=unclassified Flavobacterium TaxID=196869 RepID=UPI003AAFDBBB
MKKIFLSHATEDKPLVEHIYNKLKEKHPELEPWLDKFEIVGGSSLIDKIASGIESSEKFVIFLSDVSIQKPWVNKELKKAIVEEVKRNNTNFIIPVLINNIIKVPAFLEDKFYIEVSKYTEDELINAIFYAIDDKMPNQQGDTINNLAINHGIHQGGQIIEFKARYWAEPISFEITFDKPYKRLVKGFGQSPNTFTGTFAEEKTELAYKICVSSQKITPDNLFFLYFAFEGEIGNITKIGKWKEGPSKPMGFIIESRG